MNDLISRQAAIKALYDYWSGCSFDGDGYDIADKSEDVLNDLPSADPEIKLVAQIALSQDQIQESVDKAVEKIRAEMEEPERKKGKWIPHEGGKFVGFPYMHYECSECRAFEPTETNFCPNCGSYNGGEEDDERRSN